MALSASRPAAPIDWPVTVTVFFAGSILLWAGAGEGRGLTAGPRTFTPPGVNAGAAR